VPDGSALMGASPSATLVNIVTLFQAFFQSFGAMVVFFALLSWRSVVNGQANRSQMGLGRISEETAENVRREIG
jgi:sugar phosphate permease